MSRIDDAVSRILTAKFELGLFEHPLTNRTHLDDVGSAAHRRVARKAVAESQVLLRNQHRTLPLSSRGRVYVSGSNADNLGNQAGGWTLTWQGGSTNVFPGQTILDGIEDAATVPSSSPKTPQRRCLTVPPGSLSSARRRTPRASATSAVRSGPTTPATTACRVRPRRWSCRPPTRPRSRPCARRRASCTVVVVSGRPMVIPPDLLAQIDSLVASWLPGSEGGGVADVLFGRRHFTGKLPVTWPRTVAQEPINLGDADYDPLYAYGWGLSTRR